MDNIEDAQDCHVVDLRDFLRQKLTEGVITQTELADAIGYDISMISRYLSGDRGQPAFRFMLGVARFFDLDLYDVVRMAGYDVPAQIEDGLNLNERDLIHAYRNMSEQDRDILVRIALGFERDERIRQGNFQIGDLEGNGSLDE